jgi:hypothetical protein
MARLVLLRMPFWVRSVIGPGLGDWGAENTEELCEVLPGLCGSREFGRVVGGEIWWKFGSLEVWVGDRG